MDINAWVVQDGAIVAHNGSGDVVPLTAKDIFAIIFGTGLSRSFTHPNIFESLPGIAFSRYSAELAILLTGSLDSKIFLQIGANISDTFVALRPRQDQVVHLDKWEPVDVEALNEVCNWLDANGIAIGQPLSYRQVLWIKRCSVVRVFDDVTTDPKQLQIDSSSIPGLSATLYPYQVEGVTFLNAMADQGTGCILADEMGLGKTLQIIALLQKQTICGKTPSIVVAPATLLENWRREFAGFAPDLQVLVHSGPFRSGDPSRFSSYDVVVTSYDLLVRDEVLLNSIDWHIMVLDEAQNIKNPSTLRTLAVKRMHRAISIAVTGTPVENRLTDLWSLSDFALPGLLGTLPVFDDAFTDNIKDAETLAQLVGPIILRRNVVDVAQDLPDRIEILQPVVMSDELAAVYEATLRAIIAEYGPAGSLVATTRLRLICAHPSLASEWTNSDPGSVPKLERLFEILEEIFAAGEKALIFTSFHGMADLLVAELQARWSTAYFATIDGRTDVVDRQMIVDEFTAFNLYGALILNPRAAGTGLNITAANHVIHYNPEWNPALTAQSTARAYRRKQHRPVTVHHLYFIDTVEDEIVSRAELKSLLADAVLGQEEVTSTAALDAAALKASRKGDST